ncbi:MAG: type II secretion system protein [Campylobacterales bacterium]|nr:type II secretion system protein [Campylobacterales bacterium]
MNRYSIAAGMKGAFSLIELMLVVVIIGIVYALALSSFKPPEKQGMELFTLYTLPDYLRENFALADAKIVCFEPCGKCNLMVNGAWQEEEIELFDSSNVKSYMLDLEGFALEKEFAPHDRENAYKKACFVLHKRPNGSIESIVLEKDKKFIYYKAGYEEAKEYETLAALQSEYKKIVYEIGAEK